MSNYANFRVFIDWDKNGNYTGLYDEITADVDNGTFVVGIDDPKKRVANVGKLTLSVDNLARKYTPRNTVGPLYGKLLPGRPVRVVVEVEGQPDTILFQGVTVSFDPGSQRFENGYGVIECADLVSDYAGYDQLAIPVQFNQDADHLLRLIANDVYESIVATALLILFNLPVNNDTATIAGTRYRWRDTISVANDVKIGGSIIACLINLRNAINGGEGSGTTYHASTKNHSFVTSSITTEGGFGYALKLKVNSRGSWANGRSVEWTDGFNTMVVYFEGGTDAPAVVDFEDGTLSFEYAADTWEKGKTNALTAIEDVVNSEFGFWWVSQDGIPTFRNKDWFFKQASVAADAVLVEQQSSLNGQLTIDDVYNVVSVSYQPRRALASAVVARASNTIVVPGNTPTADRWNATEPPQADCLLIKLDISSTPGEIGGALSLLLPVAGTDYTVADDAGFDYTSSGRISMTMAVNGPVVELTMGNSASGSLFISGLQVRGTMLERTALQQVIFQDASSILDYGKRTPLTHNLPLASDVTRATAIARYLLNRYGEPHYRIETYEIENPIGTPGEAGFINMFALTIGDVIKVTEYQSGTTGKKCMIRSVEGEFQKGGLSKIVFGVTELEDKTYWILGDENYSVLGTSTRLGI